MALDLQGWVTPEQDFRGLYNLGDNFEKENSRKREDENRAAAKQAGLSTYMQGFLDPKEYLTGTVHDPHITKRLSEIMMKGMDLAKMKGMDNATLYAALSPEINKITKESLNIREIERRRKEAEGILKGQKGIDLAKVNDRVRRRAYYNEDGSLKDDLSSIDPTIDYADEVLRNDDVYTPEGIDELIAKAGKNSRTLDTRITDANKGSRRTKLQISSPEFMQPVIENGTFQNRFEPRFQVATDNRKPIEEVVIDEVTRTPKLGSNGQPLKRPVKMVTNGDWDMLLGNKSVAPYLRQEVRRYAKEHGVDPKSTQAENFGRALAWKMLDNSSKGSSNFSEVVEQKAAPIVINNGSGSGGSGSNDANYLNIYNKIYDRVKTAFDEKDKRKPIDVFDESNNPVKDYGGVPVNSLTEDEQSVILSSARMSDPEIKSKDIYLKINSDGGVTIVSVMGQKPITTLTKTGANTKANKPYGVKSRKEAMNDGEKGKEMRTSQTQKEQKFNNEADNL